MRRLSAPVVSVGNLAAGGRGKTPLVAWLARMLAESGEMPAVLTRGYRRTHGSDGVVVVSDGQRVMADLARSGDEPLMLARRLPGVGVFVAADRYLAGRLAERRFGATVHVLDDGFQHMELAREVEIVIVSAADILKGRPLPFGLLREPLETLSRASAVVIAADEGEDDLEAERSISNIHAGPVFRLRRVMGIPRLVDTGRTVDTGDVGAAEGLAQPPQPTGGAAIAAAPRAGAGRARKAIAVAGIALPERFTRDLRRAGWEVVGEVRLGDHGPITRDLLTRIERTRREAGADVVLTTEKDAARMMPHRPLRTPVLFVPMEVRPDPEEAFCSFLAGQIGERLAAARAGAQDLRSAIAGRWKADGLASRLPASERSR